MNIKCTTMLLASLLFLTLTGCTNNPSNSSNASNSITYSSYANEPFTIENVKFELGIKCHKLTDSGTFRVKENYGLGEYYYDENYTIKPGELANFILTSYNKDITEIDVGCRNNTESDSKIQDCEVEYLHIDYSVSSDTPALDIGNDIIFHISTKEDIKNIFKNTDCEISESGNMLTIKTSDGIEYEFIFEFYMYKESKKLTAISISYNS